MAEERMRALYLDLLEQALLGKLDPCSDSWVPRSATGLTGRVWRLLARRGKGIAVTRKGPPEDRTIEEGRIAEPPYPGFTMVGRRRLRNVRSCVDTILAESIPGDLIEAGVWRAGVSILMAGILRAYGDQERNVYLADSFRGLPPPNSSDYPADSFSDLHCRPELAVDVVEVRKNFQRFLLLDDRVRLIEGWFRDTLPPLRNHTWALIRLDGDLYESTIDGLRNLYPGLSPGGFLIVDDYGAYDACRQAVNDYRGEIGAKEPLEAIDWTGVYWRKELP